MSNKTIYTRYALSSKDLMIIRQQFCNDEIIGFLWRQYSENKLKNAITQVDKFLDEMVKLTIKLPTDKLVEELTACCDQYPNCSHTQPVELKPPVYVKPTKTSALAKPF